MFDYLADQAGFGIVYRFDTSDPIKIRKEFHEILAVPCIEQAGGAIRKLDLLNKKELPVLQNIIGRFLKTSRGDEGLWETREEVRRKIDGERLEVNDRIRALIEAHNGEPPRSEIFKLQMELRKEGVLRPNITPKQFAYRVYRKTAKVDGNKYLDILSTAATDKEKLAILSHVPADSFEETLMEAIRLRLISKPVVSKARWQTH